MCASAFGTLGAAIMREPLITSQVAYGHGHGVWSSRLSMTRDSGTVNFSTTPRRTIGSRRLIFGTSDTPYEGQWINRASYHHLSARRKRHDRDPGSADLPQMQRTAPCRVDLR